MSTTSDDRVINMMAKCRKPATQEALKKLLKKATRADWLAAEKLAWGDVQLDTNDCLWLRSKGLELPGKGAGADAGGQLDD